MKLASQREAIYAYADVGYFGLTHSLLAWARCHLWALDNDAVVIAPTWLRFRGRLGPWLRRESDKRQYQNLFRFPDYVTGPRRLALLATRSRISAGALVGKVGSLELGGRIVLFKNLEGRNTETYFPSLLGRQQAVREALLRMTRPALLPPLPKARHVAVHVRLGDFTVPAAPSDLRSGLTNARLPLEWYVDMVRGLRAHLGMFPVVIYSDGRAEELGPLLRMPGVTRSPPATAITDLLALSGATALVSSGSGYSLWGSYLGAVPRVCFPGQRITRALPAGSSDELEPECESAEDFPEAFVRHVATRLHGPST